MKNVVNEELLVYGVRPGVHGTYGGARGGRPRGFISGLIEGVPGGWEVEDLQ